MAIFCLKQESNTILKWVRTQVLVQARRLLVVTGNYTQLGVGFSLEEKLAGGNYVIFTDNSAGVSAVNKFGSTTSTEMDVLSKEIWNHSFEIKYNIQCAVHIPGIWNTLADAATREPWFLAPRLIDLIVAKASELAALDTRGRELVEASWAIQLGHSLMWFLSWRVMTGKKDGSRLSFQTIRYGRRQLSRPCRRSDTQHRSWIGDSGGSWAGPKWQSVQSRQQICIRCIRC
mmetsp:Transcript_34656/g.56078  ORF Transcript_34656/g.56078 Transcript_34656/m.56078 type:complete len:231 (+) Transcript_34656:228-920(+)